MLDKTDFPICSSQSEKKCMESKVYYDYIEY